MTVWSLGTGYASTWALTGVVDRPRSGVDRKLAINKRLIRRFLFKVSYTAVYSLSGFI
jgi:hypothetical protein